jgi:O-antigen/teichoic acid export membrane protein
LYTLAGPAAAGIYSSAQKLVSVLPQVAGAVEGVFATKFSDANTYRQYFYEYLRVVTILCIGVLGAMLFAPIIVPLFFGNKYLDSIGVFQVLLFGIVFFFFSGPPAAAILYRYSKPSCHLFNSALGLGVSLVAYFILIPSLGPTGAGWAFVIASAVVMVANYLWLKFIR